MKREELIPVPLEHAVCVGCATVIPPKGRFCPSCGTALTTDPKAVLPEQERAGWSTTIRFLWACGAMVVYIVGTYLSDAADDYQVQLALDAGFFLLMALVAARFFRDLRGCLRAPSFNLDRLFTYLLIQAVITFGVLYLVPLVNDALGYGDSMISWAFFNSPAPLPLALLSIAVMPAITEELACRGILFGQVERVAGGTSAVIVTGIIFAFIHFNMLSFFWLLPAGLFYGWMRLREGHLWYGILCHFLHNSAVVLEEMGYF